MGTKVRRISLWVIVGAILLSAVVSVAGEKIAIFVQAAAPVPTADVELLQNFAQQHGAVITGARVCSTGELMHAQRLTNTYIGNTLSVEGIRRLANARVPRGLTYRLISTMQNYWLTPVDDSSILKMGDGEDGVFLSLIHI